MKINDVVIKEAGFADAYALRNTKNPPPVDTTKPGTVAGTGMAGDTAKTGTGASGFPTQPAPGQGGQPKTTKKGTAKFDPAVQARQQQLIAAGAKIKADGFMGPATKAAEKQFGAQIDTAKAQVQQGQPGPTTVTNPAQATQADPAGDMADRGKVDAMAGADATAAQTQTSNYTGQDIRTANARGEDPARLQQLAGMNQTSNYTGQDIRTANARGDVPTHTSSYQGPQSNALGVQAQVPGGFGQPTPAPDQPRNQAAQPAQPAQPAKDPTVAPPVATGKDGTGPGLKDGSGKPVTSSSDDELAWVAKNGGPMANRSMYPGPGNWDPKTGRTTNAADKAMAASGANPWDGKDPAKAAAWAALSPEDQKWIGKGDPTDKFILARAPSKGGFLGSITPNFMKKDKGQPPPADTMPNANQNASSSYGGPAKEDIEALRRLSGLR